MKYSGKIIPLCILLLLSAIPAIPQAEEKRAGEDDLYFLALFASVAEMDKSFGQIKDNRVNYHHMYVAKDPTITDNLPTKSGAYSVEYLDYKSQVDLYKKLGREYALLRIFPIQNSGSRLEVTINVYYFSFKKHKLMYGLSDWSTVEFRFDCDQQKFVVSSVKLGGI